MIVFRLTIRSAESALWLTLVRERLRRFESVPLDGNDAIIWIPLIGAILRTDAGTSIILQAVGHDESALAVIREAISLELAAAVPQNSAGHRLTLDWEYPNFVPVPLRS